MQKTFTNKAVAFFKKKGERHRLLRIPAMLGLKITLRAYYIWIHFTSGWKRYVCTVFLGLLFIIGSSFSYPAFGSESTFVSSDAIEPTDDSIGDTGIEEDLEEFTAEFDMLEEESSAGGNYHQLEEMDQYSLEDILKENEEYSISQSETGQGIVSDFVFDREDWRLILINKQHTIPYDYEFALGTIMGNMQCDERIISDLLAMLKKAKEEGIDLVICSPYRDFDRQEMLFNRKIKDYMNKGFSYMDAYKISSQTVTVPGASEHQIGLALDIISNSYNRLDEGFGDTEAGKWLAKYSCEFGFILRYPKGKENITGIEFEPWHFRYVGKEAALTMTEEEITLEEFWDKYL